MRRIAASGDFHRYISTRCLVHCVVERVAAVTLSAIQDEGDGNRAQNRRQSPSVIAVRIRLTSPPNRDTNSP